MKSGEFLVCSLLLAMLAVAPALAEEAKQVNDAKPSKETNLDEMVVTATRTEKSIADAPGSVSVVTKKEMEKRNIQSADEALNLLQGVYDNRTKGLMGGSSTSNVNFRGLSGSGRTLLLLDGMPMNNAYSASQQWGGIYAQDLQQIEVVRGPSSSLYGGAAMGGVINMISAMPTKREVSLSTGYGGGSSSDAMQNLWMTHASYGDKIGKIRFYAALGYKTTDGYPTGQVFGTSAPTAASGITGATATTDSKGTKRYLVGDGGNNGWWDYSAAVRAQYDITETANVRLSWQRAASKYSYTSSPNTYLRDAAGNPVYTYRNAANTANVITENSFLSGDGATTQDTYTVSAEAAIYNMKGKFFFGVNDQNENWYNTPVTATRAGGKGTKSDSPSRTYYSDIQLSAPIMEKHVLTGGFSFKYDTADSNNFPLSDYKNPDSISGASTQWGGGVTQTYSAYLQAEIALLNNLTLYAGVRDDYWVSSDGYAGQTGAGKFSATYPEKSKNAVSPKGSAVWKPFNGTALRVSGGTAFRAPALNQLYKTWVTDSSTATTYNNSNPDLNPETVFSWDAGVEQKLWKGAMIKATYFENYIEDMISNVTTSTVITAGKTIKTTLQSNVGKAETKGVELEAEQTFGKNLRLFAGYTYTDSAITENSAIPALVGKQLTGAPRHMFNAGVDASYGPAAFFLSGRYISKRYGSDDNSDKINNVYGSYDPFFIVDTRIAYKVTDWATASFSVNNLLDREYYSYYVNPGRSYFANIDLKF
jgi:iron complex outermembrane receptor protein